MAVSGSRADKTVAPPWVTSKYLEEPEGKSSGFNPSGWCRLPNQKLIEPVSSTGKAFGPT